jgi:hypothetical protein
MKGDFSEIADRGGDLGQAESSGAESGKNFPMCLTSHGGNAIILPLVKTRLRTVEAVALLATAETLSSAVAVSATLF